jgi:toxin ParE1/3/4
MRLRFTPQAIQDITEIAGYVRKRNAPAAERVRTAILESLDHLTRFPTFGRCQDLPGARKLVIRRYPYLVYYSVDESRGEIAVLAIRHPARQRESDDM